MSSAKKEPERVISLEDQEQNWVERTHTTRAEEDHRFNQEYLASQDRLRQTLVDLYDRRSGLERELLAVRDSIAYHEEQQERLLRDYTAAKARINAQREDEDRVHTEWFKRQKESSAGPKAKVNGRSPPPSREMANPPTGNGVVGAGADGNAGGWTSINGAHRSQNMVPKEEDDEPPTDPGNLLGSGYQPMDDHEPNGRIPMRSDMDVDDDGNTTLPVRSKKHDEPRPLKPKQRHSLPGYAPIERSPAGRPKTESVQPKGSSGRRSLPGAAPRASSAGDSPAPQSADLEEITRETLVLKHNGQFYTEPPMYAGVPLERINEQHPYWDPEWQPLEEHIKPQLDKWAEKLDALRRDSSAVRHTVFLANRQVNRGQAVIDFLKGDDFHPYQYVGKEMMQRFYKTFINYDTMFRLVNVHEELKKFELDVTPLEWLRQRMWEVSMAQGDKFSLSKYTHDLYHDAKLKALREKHGFGNIGRPSGYKIGEKNPEKGKAKAKRESTGGRRKARRSIGQVDTDDPSSVEGYPLAQQQQPAADYLEPVTPRMQKRQRLDGAAPMPMPVQMPMSMPVKAEPEVDELEHDGGYTSTDSFSAGRIMHLDFRIYQIKTKVLTTSTEVTQYWTWKQDQNTFEHQVLRDVFPKVTWGYYQQPINFNVKQGEIREIQWSKESQKVNIVIDDESRGNQAIAHFKRERTKIRFLSFARKKGIRLVRRLGQELDDEWDNLKSDTLPGEDSES